MLKSNKGFTLIELLATIVVIGVIVLISVPNMVGIIDKNKDTSYIDDARRMQSIAEYRFRNTDKSTFESGKTCRTYSLKELNKNQEFDNTPNSDDEYNYENSFVVVKKESNQYNYYVYLETTKNVKYANFSIVGSSSSLNTDTTDDAKKYKQLTDSVESSSLC